jgi:hypothetical protein
MSSAKYEELGKGIIKRSERKKLGLFIDGTGLDRATRRINRKVDLAALVRGVTAGGVPTVARYYTLIPYEDDSRQRAFLDAVARAGLTVVVKRLPPKGVTRQVSVDVEMAADIVAFALGHYKFSDLSEYKVEANTPRGSALPTAAPFMRGGDREKKSADAENKEATAAKEGESADERGNRKERRLITLVCPSRDLSYSIALSRELGVDTTTADFGQFNSNDILKSAAKWIDLSDSETIWKA